MTTQSFPIDSVGCDPTRNPEVEDDLSTATTPPVGYRNSDGDHEFVSKTIRFNFTPVDSTRIDSINPAEIHAQWLRIIASTFGSEVKIINNNNKPVVRINTNGTTETGKSHDYQFKLHQKSVGVSSSGTPKTAFTIVHRILIRIPFSQIKRHSPAFQLLREHNCFLREHMWDEQEWDVQQIGFVTGFNPKYYTPEKATLSFRAHLCKAMPQAKVPKFQMILKTHKILNQGRTSSTQAFTLEVPTHSAPQLIAITKDVTKDSKEYVPFQMRRKNPDAFQGAIRYQNHILANQHVFMINYLGMDAMYYLADRIKVIPGVQDVIPTTKVLQNGKFYVLVDKKEVNKARQSLQERFNEWYKEAVPPDAKPKEGQFDGPPEVPTPKTDGYSSGDNSWLTASTKSFMEFSVTGMDINASKVSDSNLDHAWDNRTTETTQSPLPTPSKRTAGRTYTSYAAATVSDQVSGMTESEPPRDARHEELTNKIATLEAMIVQLCQQVQVLTNNSAQQQMSHHHESSLGHREKRTDRKDSPRKHKQPQQYSAPSGVAEDTNESAPMEEDRRTAWDDYESNRDDDL